MKTCIVVDDSGFDRRINVLCAEKVGFSVTAVGSGEEALEICNKKLPDCILLDLEMAGMSGMDLVRRLLKIPRIEKTSIIICTSHDHPSFVQQAHIHGAAFITKPVTHYKLKDQLDELELMRTILAGNE